MQDFSSVSFSHEGFTISALQSFESHALAHTAGPNTNQHNVTNAVDSTNDQLNPTVKIPPPLPSLMLLNDDECLMKNNKKKMMKKKKLAVNSSLASSFSSSSVSSLHRGVRVANKRRNPRNLVGPTQHVGIDADAIALPLGMSIAAVLAKVLERKDSAGKQMSVNHLSMVFGDKSESFARNFEKSFSSTLRTIRLINESSRDKGGYRASVESSTSDGTPLISANMETSSCEKDCPLEADSPTAKTQEQLSTLRPLRSICESSRDKGGYSANHLSVESSASGGTALMSANKETSSCQKDCPLEADSPAAKTQEQLSTLRRLINKSSRDKGGYNANHLSVESSISGGTPLISANKETGSCKKDCPLEADSPTAKTQEQLSTLSDIDENVQTGSANCQLALYREINQQLASVSPGRIGYAINQSMLNTFEKSVGEQARANDLKTFEISLLMKNLELKETKLALNSDSNLLERLKLSMGISKASFKAEKFKNQLEDTRHAELLKKCIDCLVAGLFIMSASLGYGVYIHSYERIAEATALCAQPKESRSWWIPKPVTSLNSGLQTLGCQVQILSRMLFGVLMILVIAYSLLRRSATSSQAMPVTFILLILGVACGFAGKVCVDTLGGNGYHWLVYWEALCLLHFISNVRTSNLFSILYGPITASPERKDDAAFPYWIRQFLFYAIVLLFLPALCGLMPFASASEWRDHFMLLAMDYIGLTSG